jgi:hypothetical protein
MTVQKILSSDGGNHGSNKCKGGYACFLKDSFYRNNAHAVEELQGKFTAAVDSISEALAAVMDSINHCLQMVLLHMDHTLNMFFACVINSQVMRRL